MFKLAQDITIKYNQPCNCTIFTILYSFCNPLWNLHSIDACWLLVALQKGNNIFVCIAFWNIYMSFSVFYERLVLQCFLIKIAIRFLDFEKKHGTYVSDY